jgi:hypothetical protein
MNNFFKSVFVLYFVLVLFGCASTPKDNGKYRITYAPSLNSDPMIMGAWMQYTAHIRSDMNKYYAENPEGNYLVPYNIELTARNSMIDFYLRVQKDYKISDPYIEDLIKIRNAKLLNEYVFFSFNPGNWTNDENYQEENYNVWIKNNMPEHIPLTLAHIERTS